MDELRKRSGVVRKENFALKTFLLGLLLAAIVFVPYMVVDGGRFLFYGDFNVQQVPFYRLAHDAIRAGELGWNYKTDLGANFIGSYSFYLLGSPFFWLTLPLPSQWLQYCMGPLLILKFACAALTGYLYLRRYTRSGETAMIGAVLYAFSGFSVYNIFFNHFHEAIVFYPLMLAALDEYMATRRRGLFALTVFACAFVNYYFFVGQVTFTLLYFFLRLLCGSWKISWKDFLLLGLEAVLGFGLACVILVPSILAVLQNNRTTSTISGWNAILYNRNQRYLHIIECFFFPPDLPARPNFTPDSESRWASLGAWLPLFSMSGVIGWLQLRRRHWLKKMVWILFLMALVPFLNSSFQLMNSAYYARWYYMLVLMLCLATVLALEEERTDWRRSILWTLVITVGIAGVIGLMPQSESSDTIVVSSLPQLGLEQYPARYWAYVAVAVMSLALLAFLFQFRQENKKRFVFLLKLCTCIVAVFYSLFFIGIGKAQTEYTWDHLIPYSLNSGKDIDLPDLQECRSDFYDSVDNAGMFWEIPTIQAFHSIVPGSVMEFYQSIGVTRDVASRPETDHYSIRGLLSVHWLFDDDHDNAFFAGSEYGNPAMPGWAYYGNANGFDIWENQYYVPMGFSYENYITRSTYDRLQESDREKMMLRAIVAEDEDAAALSEVLTELSSGDYPTFDQDQYLADCQARAATACQEFSYVRNGFAAELKSPRRQILFFSVPWESGWSAEVNGEPADIYKVNVGFMAVVVPEGEQVSVEFHYRTPGLGAGAVITLVSLGILALYLLLAARARKKKAPPKKRESLIRPQRFSEYCRQKRLSFLRPGGMTPRWNPEEKKEVSPAPQHLQQKEESPQEPEPDNEEELVDEAGGRVPDDEEKQEED